MSDTQRIIHELNATIGGFTVGVNVKVKEVEVTTDKIRASADTTLKAINDFKTTMIENEQMQSAQENVLRIDQIMRERFSDNDTIRKTVMGVVKDFDLNLVRNKTIDELSQELWLTNSRYWLAYTLIALSAWVNDNKILAENAISESYRTSSIKTALFFCLTNLRFGRIDAARLWLFEYFKTVVPEDLKDEASIVLHAYINGLFGADEKLQQEVKSVIDDWLNTIKNDEAISEELTLMYSDYIKNLKVNAPFTSIFLCQYCLNYKEIPYSYDESTKYEMLLNKVKAVDIADVNQTASNYKKRVDIILKDLIANFDEEELELKHQQEYFQLIINHKGKEEDAFKEYEKILETRNSKHNFGKKCVQWALYESDQNINVHVRKFSFQNTKTWFLNSILDWSGEVDEKYIQKFKIRFNTFDTNIVEFETEGSDRDVQLNKVTEFITSKKKSIRWDKKTKSSLASSIVFILLTALFVFLGVTYDKSYFTEFKTVLLVLGALFGILTIVFLVKFIKRIKGANKRFMDILNRAKLIINGCYNEIAKYQETFVKNSEIKAELISYVEHL